MIAQRDVIAVNPTCAHVLIASVDRIYDRAVIRKDKNLAKSAYAYRAIGEPLIKLRILARRVFDRSRAIHAQFTRPSRLITGHFHLQRDLSGGAFNYERSK